jgi:endoglucanase
MMHKHRRLLSCCVAVLFPLFAEICHAKEAKHFAAGAPVAAQAGSTAVEQHGHLRVKGNRIVDEHGEPVLLRGMSLFRSLWMTQYYNAQMLRWLRDDWHANVIRVAMEAPPPGYLEHPDVEMKKVETMVDAAIDLGMYVIVDWHTDQPAPDGAGRFFGDVAAKYGKYPNVIYETYNEPLADQAWHAVVKPYHEAVIAKIRAQDPDNLIVCGTQTWSQDVDKAAADPIEGRNIAYSLHFYGATHKAPLRQKAQRALDQGAAIFVTEWGTSEATGDGKLDRVETQAWLDFMDKNQLSWCNWSIADKQETSAALKPGAVGTGGWPADVLTPSGVLVRAEMRAKDGAASAAEVH